MKKDLISIIIVNWNGKKWLQKCLSSLYAQTYKNFEIVFVDNGSTDDSVNYVRNNFPHTRIVRSEINLGFAGGNNLGYKKAKGEFILLLNNDIYVRENFLKDFLKAFKEIPNLASVQSKIVLMDNPQKLDLVGAYWTDSSFLYYYGLGKDAKLKKYNIPMPFFSNKGASMMIKRQIIEKIGLFDEDFFNYYEETDFCHRAWLAGYECWYWPEAVVYHALGGTSITFDNSFIQYHNFKNKLLSFLKNFERNSLITIVPTFLFINLVISIYWLTKGKYKHFLALYKAIYWNIRNLNNTLRKRSIIKLIRVRNDKNINNIVKINPKPKYYLYLLTGNLSKYRD